MARRAIKELFGEIKSIRHELRTLQERNYNASPVASLPVELKLEHGLGYMLPASRRLYAEAAPFLSLSSAVAAEEVAVVECWLPPVLKPGDQKQKETKTEREQSNQPEHRDCAAVTGAITAFAQQQQQQCDDGKVRTAAPAKVIDSRPSVTSITTACVAKDVGLSMNGLAGTGNKSNDNGGNDEHLSDDHGDGNLNISAGTGEFPTENGARDDDFFEDDGGKHNVPAGADISHDEDGGSDGNVRDDRTITPRSEPSQDDLLTMIQDNDFEGLAESCRQWISVRQTFKVLLPAFADLGMHQCGQDPKAKLKWHFAQRIFEKAVEGDVERVRALAHQWRKM